jgi:hypothetical protein
MLALADGRWASPRFGRSSSGGIIELALAQSVDKITREDDPLALPPVQPLLDKMIDPAFNVFVERLWRSLKYEETLSSSPASRVHFSTAPADP